jgi:hypothetical protein
MGVYCAVIVPSLIPHRSGERVKTDRLDALRLVRCFRAGERPRFWFRPKNRKLCATYCVQQCRQAQPDLSHASAGNNF